ncbi:hypothetical protein OG204_12265 [Streptomyces sp. NBC_01387]|uniref:hypothetical protein n=1 Tax=Streptomyces sp. NBC_01387 TaxID=2903849 RepID=UPI0032468880
MDLPVNQCFLISKYDEAKRAGEVADWTSYEDVGADFNGRVLTAQEYYRTEDLYISAVKCLATATGTAEFTLRNIFLNAPAPPWLGDVYDGRVVDLRTAMLLIRGMLRDGWISCFLENAGILRIGVETDFYLSAEIHPSTVGSLADIERMGLHTMRVDCWEEDEDVLVSRPADVAFWAKVAAEARRTAAAAVVLERWAQGPFGCRWYLVEDGDVSAVAASMAPQSLVTAFFGVEIYWATRTGLTRSIPSSMHHDPSVVIFSPSDGNGALEAVVCGEGVAVPGEAELPPGDELGFFEWPDEEGSLVVAVVPGEDGRIVARWPDPRTE